MSTLYHNYVTHKNEAMNNSMASYTPKANTYSLTDPLLVKILGYCSLWLKVYPEFGMEVDPNLEAMLRD